MMEPNIGLRDLLTIQKHGHVGALLAVSDPDGGVTHLLWTDMEDPWRKRMGLQGELERTVETADDHAPQALSHAQSPTTSTYRNFRK